MYTLPDGVRTRHDGSKSTPSSVGLPVTRPFIRLIVGLRGGTSGGAEGGTPSRRQPLVLFFTAPRSIPLSRHSMVALNSYEFIFRGAPGHTSPMVHFLPLLPEGLFNYCIFVLGDFHFFAMLHLIKFLPAVLALCKLPKNNTFFLLVILRAFNRLFRGVLKQIIPNESNTR